MGACTSSPRATLSDEPDHKLARKNKAEALIKAEVPGEPMVSTPEAVNLTNQPSWTEGHSPAAHEAGVRTSSNSFTIKTEGRPPSCACETLHRRW